MLGGNENLFKFWLEIQRTEPSLIRLFDLFLTNAGEVSLLINEILTCIQVNQNFLFLSLVSEIQKLADEKEILIESRKLNKLQGLLQSDLLWPQTRV